MTDSFADISRLSNQAANVFKANGVKKGDTVLVILKRNYEYWYIAPALQKLGAVVIPATHLLKVEDLGYCIRTAGISAAVGTPDGKHDRGPSGSTTAMPGAENHLCRT